MNVGVRSKPTAVRTVGLASIGILVGAVGWLYALYLAAFAAGADGSTAAARTVTVVLHVGVIVGLTITGLRTQLLRGLVFGALIGFTGVTLLYWIS